MLQFDIENLIAVALSNIYLNFIGKLPQKMACFEIYVKSFPYQKSSTSRQLQQLPFFSSQQSRKIPRVQIKDDLMLTAKPISRLLMIGLTICRAERVSVI